MPFFSQRQPSATTRELESLLNRDSNPHWQRVNRDVIGPVIASMESRPGDPEVRFVDWVAKGLHREIEETRRQIEELKKGHEAFNSRHSALAAEADQRENILSYAEELGSTAAGLRGDRKAFQRHFGHDAMVARFHREKGDRERKLTILFDCLGTVGRECLGSSPDSLATWKSLKLAELATGMMDYEGDERVATAGLRALATAIAALPREGRKSSLSRASIQMIVRAAMDRERDTWLQSEGFLLLAEVDPESFREVARLRMADPPEGDDFWVRKQAVPAVLRDENLRDLVGAIASDPSPSVRQRFVESIHYLADDEEIYSLLEGYLKNDEDPAVRGSACLKAGELAATGRGAGMAARTIEATLFEQSDDWVLRVACKVISDTHRKLTGPARTEWKEILYPALNRLNREHQTPAVRRWAAHAREKLWCYEKDERAELVKEVETLTRKTPVGKSVTIQNHHAVSWSDEELGRVLSVAVQEDFGLDVTRKANRLKLTRGDRMGFRLWRFLFELKNASPDKRQAFRHTIGRLYDGRLRIPSVLLSEMSMTKVPGEPYTISEEAGWRSMLPLVDEVISAMDETSPSHPLKIVGSEGVTLLKPPRSHLRKVKAIAELNANFPHFALLRNTEPGDYIAELRKLGIEVDFFPHHGEHTEPSIGEWFAHRSAFLPFALPMDEAFNRIREYFYSAYSNTLEQLFVFLMIASGFFVGRHVYLNQVFFRLRNKIPLIVGGWGTRGKSGTERIKAALFNALGHRMVSKTTGCEAMFLYADSFGKTHELFLFRPYDKATIWEQVNIVNLAARLGSHVFLWECMGLTPAYINIIQRQWMRDDIATIVNTYPDHEDLQGPAGVNIPQVMTYFIRKNGHCITSEQQMTPILEEAAREMDSDLTKVGWLEPGLLPVDVLDRFPYAEHPNNIALVKELGTQLSLPGDYSVKEMSDRVVPDLGVLKVYAPAKIQGRRLQFVNGCSANERFGALGNWTRLEFDKQDPRAEPGVWISAVINNRADRIARSRVFAAILADDIYVDRVFLIGSNLQGMRGYSREAFEARTAQMSLFGEPGKTHAEVWREWALMWRQPTTEEELRQTIDAMDRDMDIEPFKAPYETAYGEYRALANKLEGAASGGDEALDREARQLLWTWFERRFVIVTDYFSTGDQTMNCILQETPPGYLHKIMGMQNIKGTGLDFVYRWQAWDNCYNACQMIKNRKLKIAREGLAALAAFKDFGILCEEEVLETVAEGIRIHGTRDKGIKDQLKLIEAGMTEVLTGIKATLGASKDDAGTGWLATFKARVIHFLESLLDGGDAICRRRAADRVYRDMAALRISPAKAASEIQRLNKRQKGGWLAKDLKARFEGV